MEPPSLIIAVSSEKERSTLERIVGSCHWTIYQTTSCEETIRLAKKTRPHTVLCDAELPDGGWQRIWAELSSDLRPPQVIVASQHADENLWVQVLSEGAHDVLLKPFAAEEVVWTIGCGAPQHGRPECCLSAARVC